MSRLTELIKDYQKSVDYLIENWDVTTRHMEMGEIRQHREHCQREDDTLTFLIELQRHRDLEKKLCELLVDMIESFPFKDSDFVVGKLKDIIKEIENE